MLLKRFTCIGSLFIFVVFSTVSCGGNPDYYFSADNKNAEIYILNFRNKDANVVIDNDVRTVIPAEIDYGTFLEYKTKYKYEDSRVCFFLDRFTNNEYPFMLGSDVLKYDAEEIVGKLFRIQIDGKDLLNSKVRDNLDNSYCIHYLSFVEYSAEKIEYWENGDFVLAFDPDGEIEMLLDWSKDNGTELSNPRYVLIIPPEI